MALLSGAALFVVAAGFLSTCCIVNVTAETKTLGTVDFAHANRLRFGRDNPDKCKNAFEQLNDEDKHYKFRAGEALLVAAPCFGDDSIGNSMSVYIEGRICATATGLPFVAAPKTEPGRPELANHSFFKNLPALVIPSSLSPQRTQAEVEKICPCQSICHEWNYGLMHKNMPLAGSIFRQAIEAFYQESLLQHKSDELQFTRLRPDSGSKVVWRNNIIDIDDAFVSKKDVINEIGRFPVVPDVAVHYRCGDNLVTHYGFLPFAALKSVISVTDRTIYIMAEHPSRRTDQRRKERCRAIFDGLLHYLMKHFPNAVVVLLRGHDMFEDLARLTFAKTTICSVSTFCLWPAVASNTSAYYPVTKLIAKEDISFDYGPSFHWLKDHKFRVLRGQDAAHMPDAEVLRYLSRD